MAEYTRPATWADLQQLARFLEEEGAEYLLIGGYAIAAHGYNRFSEDIDILVNPAPENTLRWIHALSRLPDGAARELETQPELFQREGYYAIRINDEFTVDVMPAACGHSWQELSQYATRVMIEGQALPVLSLEGLLLTKQGMRDKDRADAAVLRAAIARLAK